MKKNGRDNVTVDDLVRAITPKGRGNKHIQFSLPSFNTCPGCAKRYKKVDVLVNLLVLFPGLKVAYLPPIFRLVTY